MLSISLLHENIDVCLAVFMESCLMSVSVSSSGCKCFLANSGCPSRNVIVALILDMAIDVVILRGEIGASTSPDSG